MPRVVTMIASATEIVCALGCEADLVGRSHECDYPPSVKALPVCTAPRFEIHGSSREIDDRVKALLGEAQPIYHVDPVMLEALRPDVIITQSHCEVCAVSDKDVDRALAQALPRAPTVVSLAPNNLAEVWTSIRIVADALKVSSRGEELIRWLQQRVDRIAQLAATAERQPTVACLEWLDPFMAAGNWVPELVTLAGGRNLFGEAGKHSPWMTFEALLVRDPDVIIAMPCGFDLKKTRIELADAVQSNAWGRLRAVQSEQVYIVDGNQYFNRPGPRLVESLEILAEIFHPRMFAFGHRERGAACGLALAWRLASAKPQEAKSQHGQ